MDRLRNRLIAAFIVATLVPLAATIWVASSLLDRSLEYATTSDLDRLSRTLEQSIRQFYQRERDGLREAAIEGRLPAQRFVEADRDRWPAEVRSFWDGGEPERFELAGEGGDELHLLRREPGGVAEYRRDLGGIRMQALSDELGAARTLVGSIESRDLRRGFTLTFLLLIGVVWAVSLVPIVLLARRVSRPIQSLTAGLADFAAGDWDRRVPRDGDDEVGRAVDAFNRMAEQLRHNRDRLVSLARMASWQSLARKTAHEVKNSLTPIRLTVEEMVARQPAADAAFMEQAAQIVVSEIESLEARVRAFSELGSEPPVRPEPLDVNAIVRDRVALLRAAHPGTAYTFRLAADTPRAWASADLVKGILTNLLENAADAAGAEGAVLVTTGVRDQQVVVEVHDSGAGLSEAAASTLFEPTVSFKRHGMGLGLSIARKNALVSGGDITLVPGELNGAGFRVTLPVAPSGS